MPDHLIPLELFEASTSIHITRIFNKRVDGCRKLSLALNHHFWHMISRILVISLSTERGVAMILKFVASVLRNMPEADHILEAVSGDSSSR